MGAEERAPGISPYRRRIIAAVGVLGSLFALSVALLPTPPVANAQGPAYAASPPTLGALYRDGQAGRYLLGGEWLYRADPGDQGLAAGWWNDVAATDGWSVVSVPNAYNAGDLSTLSNSGYVGWYRRDFTLPAHAFASYVPAAGRHWIIRFESVNYRATVWLNGRLVGSHTGAYLPFEFDLHPRSGVNRLIVRVDDRRGAGDLPPGPMGGWWNYGGLLREVYLRAVQQADIENLQLRTILPCPRCAATIQEQAWIRNVTATRQRVTLSGRFGGLRLQFGHRTLAPHATWVAHATAVVAHPRLWAPGHPTLYKATLALTDARGRTLGGYTTYSGIRSIKVNANGHLTLNGRLLNLRGAFIHEQNYLTGAALSPGQLASLMGWERELGADVIRSHYPLNPEILEMADRYGILVWDEIPVYQVADQYLGSAAWRTSAYSMLRQNILDNQNHPSVILWSVGNELPTPATANEASYIAGAAALARRLDPTRPVGMAISSWPGVSCQSAYAPLDVIGYNDYFGWYDSGGGTTDDRDALSPYLDSLRACYPRKALFVTEFGFEANRDGPVEERGTYEFQSNSAAFHLGVFASKPWLSGAIYFALQDFAAQPGWTGGNPLPDPPWHLKGLIDRYGVPKPAFSVVSAIYHHTVQVGPAAPAAGRRAPAGSRRGV
ncbi:MAG TPA: glycoside hydrolase family 2 TIM barrel-domain containing protein [Solirubrobacteraceae bacterium]|nr:glycoside hydrolase family 2 TIM barrel-domain containing protein [Solirubrobacteraceae bacterium]